jgi:hypothetical protein
MQGIYLIDESNYSHTDRLKYGINLVKLVGTNVISYTSREASRGWKNMYSSFVCATTRR